MIFSHGLAVASPAGQGTPPTLSAGTPLTRGSVICVRSFANKMDCRI